MRFDWGVTGRCDLITYRTQALQSLSVIMETSKQWRDHGTSAFLRCWQSFIPCSFIWQSLASHLTVSCVHSAKCCFLTAPHVIFHACFGFVPACRAGQSLLSNVKKRKIRQACVWNSFLFFFSKNEFSFNRCLWDLALSRIFTGCWQWLRQFSAAGNFIWTSLACTVDDLLDVQGCFLGLDCDLISAFKRVYESNWQLVFLCTLV